MKITIRELLLVSFIFSLLTFSVVHEYEITQLQKEALEFRHADDMQIRRYLACRSGIYHDIFVIGETNADQDTDLLILQSRVHILQNKIEQLELEKESK